MIKIESSSNNIYKYTKKLLGKNERKKTSCFIIEGERIVRDAYKNGAEFEYILLEEGREPILELSNVKTYQISSKLFDDLKGTVSSQGILAVVKCPDAEFKEDTIKKGGCYLYLDCVSDPGNMGTILRSADAFGVDGIILSKGCVDVYNPKVIRSTMSAIFNVKLFFDDGYALEDFKNNGYKIIGTFPNGEIASPEYDYTDKCVIVMGNEANGICDEVSALCNAKLTIPMTGGAESLNVSVACGIILYEAYVYRTKKL